MGSERQCGLSSLLPMSCRGRAEAFARRLHTRLRRLGTEPGGSDGEAAWLTGPAPPPPHSATSTDSDAFFDFDVELESPSSPVDDIAEQTTAAASSNRFDPESGCVFSSPVDNESPPPPSSDDVDAYYDVARGLNHRLKLSSTPASEIIDHLLLQNKAAAVERCDSPIRTQPLARENGFADYGSLDHTGGLYSPIKFDDCKRRRDSKEEDDDVDEVDCAPPPRFFPRSPSPEPIRRGGDNDDQTVIEDDDSYTKSIAENEDSESDLVDSSTVNSSTKDDDDEYEQSPNNDTTIRLEVTEEEEEASKPLEDDTSLATDATDKNYIGVEQGEEAFPDDADDRPQRVRRCSSLRTGKTPPGTPGRKKIVRFADVLGLDLADVKTFMDDIPNIPKSAFEDLTDADISCSPLETSVLLQQQRQPPKSLEKRLVPLFQQPGDQPNFLDVLGQRCVCLENAVVQEGATIAVYGTVRVRNVDFHKSVQIRYTLDDWKSYSDLQATYVPNSCDGFSDRFQFLLYAHTLTAGQRLQFAVRFMCKGCQYWDNNQGANYGFQCISTGGGGPAAAFFGGGGGAQNLSPVHSWQASFY